jgi:hypothetical protein
MADIKIKGNISRNINQEMWEKDIANMKKMEDEGLARLAAVSTILEGNRLPLGITKGQDVAARRIEPALLQKIPNKPDQFGRVSMDGVDPHLAKAAILQEKIGKLKDTGKEPTDRAVMTAFNGEDQEKLKAKTGNDYVGWLSSILIDIAMNPGNEQARKMMGSLLMPNSRDRR